MNSRKSGPVCCNHPSDTSDLLIQLTVHHQVMVKKRKVKVLVTQSCLTVTPWKPARPLCPWNSPGKKTGVDSLSLSRASSQSGHQTQVSRIAGGFFTIWATREARVMVGVSTAQSKEITKLRAVRRDLVTEQQLAVLFELQVRIFFLTYLS